MSLSGNIDFSGLLNGNVDCGDGTEVIANPTGSATDTLNKIQIDETIYSVEGGGGGTEVIANPTGTPTEDINTIEISDVIYQIVGEEGPEGPQGPKGDTGATGPQGPKGDTGEGVPSGGLAGQVIIKDSSTDYDTSWTTLDASDIPYDNTTSGMTATDVQDAVTELKSNLSQLDGLIIYKDLTPTDDYAEFNDGSNLPLISLISTIEPIQSGSGDPSPENIRTISGWNKSTISDVGDNWGDCADIPEPLTANKWYIVNLPYNTYTISFDVRNVVRTLLGNTSLFATYNGITNTNILADRIYSVEDGSSYQSKGANVSGRFYFTYTGKVNSIGCFWRSNSYQGLSSGSLENIMIEVGNNPTKQYTPYNGQTYTIPFVDGQGQSLTVYSGTLDVVSGVLVVDRASVDLGTLNWTYQTAQTVFSTSISGLKRGILICSNYKYTDINNVERMNDGEIWDKGNAFAPTNVVVKDLRYTDAIAFKTAMNGVQLVYELATPQTYQLNPTQVSSLLGQNYISSDVGDITNVKYLGILNLS